MITVHMKCLSEETSPGLKPEEEFRTGDIMVPTIQGYYSFHGGGSMIECLGTNYVVRESVREIRSLIRNARVKSAFIVFKASDN